VSVLIVKGAIRCTLVVCSIKYGCKSHSWCGNLGWLVCGLLVTAFVRMSTRTVIVIPGMRLLALSFHIALVFLRVSAALLQGAYSHTQKHMCSQRIHQITANREGRVSLVFASHPLAGVPCFREIGRMAWCAQVSPQSVRHRSGCEARKAASATRQCHSQPSSVLASAAGHYAC